MITKNRIRDLDDWEVLCTFLPDDWREAARACGALRRARVVRDAETLLRVLLVHLADGCSLQETSLRARQAGWCDLSPVAIFKRLAGSEEWLRWLAERLWRQHHSRTTPQPKGRRVRAVDATTIQEAGATGTDWRVHYVLDLATLQCDYFELTDVHGGETFRRIPVRRGDVLLGDRVYGNPPGVAHVVGAGGSVLVRLTLVTLPLYSATGRRIPILARLRTLRIGEIGQWPAYVHPGAGPIGGRLIAVKRGRRAAARVRARLARHARKKGKAVGRKALAAADYVLVWTNLPAELLSAAEALELYRVRWQIELAFKRMKSILGLGQLPKSTDASARAWIHGKLLVALLIERLLDAAESLSPWGYCLPVPAESLARDPLSST